MMWRSLRWQHMGDIEPIEDREDCVGGIESMTVDGQRWYFGFDYSMDTAVSPLIDDAERMAVFASEHMLQRDGRHDVDYWRELVEMSVGQSDLVEEEADRTYDSKTLTAQRLSPSSALMYLLGAATGWDDSFFDEEAVQAALTTIGVREHDRDWDCLERCMEAAQSQDSEVSSAGTQLMTRYVDFIMDRAPANWPQVFAALKPMGG